MTWYCRETPDSRRESEDSRGQRTAIRIFHVDAAADETLDTSLLVRAKFGATADNGEQLPSYAFGYVNDLSLLASHPDIESIDPVARLWRVTWHYKSLTAGEVLPEQVGYVEWSSTGDLEFRDKWRLGYAMPPGNYPTATIPPGVEQVTQGAPIDSAGVPVSVMHLTATVAITEVIGTPPPWATIREAIGTRNSAVFGGYPIGSLLYLPPVVSKAGPGKYRIEHRFAYDQDYHLLMTVKRNGDGDPILTVETDGGGVVTKSYAAVTYWTQPFQGLYNFYAISTNFVGFA